MLRAFAGQDLSSRLKKRQLLFSGGVVRGSKGLVYTQPESVLRSRVAT